MRILPKNSAKRLECRRECGYLSVFENTPEKLILQSIFPLKVAATLHSGWTKSTVEAYCQSRCQSYMLIFQDLMYIEGRNQIDRPIWNYEGESWHPGNGAKLYCIIHLNCGEVCNHEVVKQPEHGRSLNNVPPFRGVWWPRGAIVKFKNKNYKKKRKTKTRTKTKAKMKTKTKTKMKNKSKNEKENKNKNENKHKNEN